MESAGWLSLIIFYSIVSRASVCIKTPDSQPLHYIPQAVRGRYQLYVLLVLLTTPIPGSLLMVESMGPFA